MLPRELVVRPIGYVRSPFGEKVEAPRQGVLAEDVLGTVELLPEYRDALADLEGFERVWLIFWFDRAVGWKPKVLPPRSEVKRGVFATRSPHRPNPIGMTAVRLDRVADLTLHIRDLDLVDGTPVLDLKPYIPYADAFPEAGSGWLQTPRDAQASAAWDVAFDVEEPLAWIHRETGLDVRARIRAALSLGPHPHAYRRIKDAPDGRRVLAVKQWRAIFRVDDAARRIVVERIRSGYRPRDLAEGGDPVHALHRAFAALYP